LSSLAIHGKVFGGGRGQFDEEVFVLPHLHFGKKTMLKPGKFVVPLAFLLTLLISFPPALAQLRIIKNPRGRVNIKHLSDVERRIYQLTNAVRRKHHLSPLDKDNSLVATARAHSDDMLERNFFSHVNPDGKTPQKRIAPAYSRTIARAGENIWGGHGYDYSDSQLMARVIVDSWVSSPGHRANLLNPSYTHLGVGVSVLGKEVRATQNFVQR
jgi:uncharacterized protein YkwD